MKDTRRDGESECEERERRAKERPFDKLRDRRTAEGGSPERAKYISEGCSPSEKGEEREWRANYKARETEGKREKMKTGLMSIKLFLVFGGLICLVMMLSTGCRRPFDNTNNVLRVDSLEQLITGIDNQLILDENVFKQRDDSMVIKLNLIHSKMPKIKDGDTSESVLRFEGIEKNYSELLKNYPVMEYDQSEYKKSVDAIKQRVIDQKISQTEFDDYYIKTKPLLSDLYKRAKTLTYDNISIEHDYQRTDEVVNALCDKLNGKGSGIRSK